MLHEPLVGGTIDGGGVVAEDKERASSFLLAFFESASLSSLFETVSNSF